MFLNLISSFFILIAQSETQSYCYELLDEIASIEKSVLKLKDQPHPQYKFFAKVIHYQTNESIQGSVFRSQPTVDYQNYKEQYSYLFNNQEIVVTHFYEHNKHYSSQINIYKDDQLHLSKTIDHQSYQSTIKAFTFLDSVTYQKYWCLFNGYKLDHENSKFIYENREIIQLAQIYPENTQYFIDQANRKDRVIVGVIDSGVDYNHPSIAYKIQRSYPTIGYDFQDGDHYPYDKIDSQFDYFTSNHGTHVSGIIAKDWEDLEIIPMRPSMEDPYSYLNAVNLLVARGARVINISMGVYQYEALEIAIAQNPDVLFIAAAGNNSDKLEKANNDIEPIYPASFPYPNIISVAALNEQENDLAYFSNIGKKSVDLAAPGSKIKSITPENSYKEISGTSMAAPQVTRVAAKILFLCPKLSSIEVKEIILESVTKIAELESLLLTGGKLNEEGALEFAKDTCQK